RADSVLVLDAIRLFESGIASACDSVWVVTAAPEVQVARLCSERGLAEMAAWQRVRAQAPAHEKVSRADVVIDNSGSLTDLRKQVDAAWEATVSAWLAVRVD